MIKINKKKKIINYFGIRFYDWSYEKIIKKINLGGYLVAPAAFPLCEIDNNSSYYNSLRNSRIAIFDSGFLCILFNLFLSYKVKKFSGFLFLKKLLEDKNQKKKTFLLVDPTKEDSKVNLILLKNHGFKNTFSYISPIYENNTDFFDQKLFKLINKIKPEIIIINISGLKQERLAYNICKSIKIKVAIFCLGAAISFITKKQAPINLFFDKYYFGWLLRIIYSPHILLRVIKSLKLIKYFY